MNRRKALKNLGLSLGTITLSPAVLSLLHSCKSDLDWNPVFFSSDHVNIVAELSDLIIPSGDNIPGSKELNLVKFIDLYIHNISNKKDQDLLKKSTNAFLRNCLTKSTKNNLVFYSKNLYKGAPYQFHLCRISSKYHSFERCNAVQFLIDRNQKIFIKYKNEIMPIILPVVHFSRFILFLVL